MWDCFNSRHSIHKNIFKRTLSRENKRIVFDFFDEIIKYFTSLKVEVIYYKKNETKNGHKTDDVDSARGNKKRENSKKEEREIDRIEVKPILHTNQKIAFRGFIIDIISLKSMFQLYVEEENFLDSIPTYNLLKDVLEMMFSRIRSCGGFNNNPNIPQLKGAFRYNFT